MLPYRAVVVDEAQDLGAEALKLIAAIAPKAGDKPAQDSLFIVGDAHQRIYGRKEATFDPTLSEARISCLWPAGGIQDNTVNRLLLMSSSEHHLASAPMALFVKSNVPER